MSSALKQSYRNYQKILVTRQAKYRRLKRPSESDIGQSLIDNRELLITTARVNYHIFHSLRRTEILEGGETRNKILFSGRLGQVTAVLGRGCDLGQVITVWVRDRSLGH